MKCLRCDWTDLLEASMPLDSEMVKLIERGQLRPMLAESFPLRELAKAQEAFMAKKHVGNIVVTP